ncbi:transglutaminase-like domain-containing protein [Fusibacter bizertensis]
MDNKSKLTKWVTGYFIFLSLMFTLNYFLKLSVDISLFGLVTLMVYFGIYVIKRYKNISLRVAAILIIFLLFIYGADYVLTSLSKMKTQDLVIENESQTLDSAEGIHEQIKRHDVAIIQNLRDALDYKKVMTFGRWVADERIGKQMINGEKIDTNKKYEFYLLVLISFFLTLILYLIFRFKWLKLTLLIPILLFVWLWYQFIDLPWIYSAIYFAGVVAFFIMDHHEKLLLIHPDFNTAYYPAGKLMITSITTGIIIIAIAGITTTIFPIKQVNYLVDFITPNMWGARSGYTNSQLKMYSLKETAFQGESEILGGPVRDINTVDPIFWVKFDHKIDKAVYLKTTIKDNYDGLKWSNNGITYKTNFKYYLSDEKNVKLLTSGDFDGISGSIKINKKLTKTVTLFTPMGLYKTSLGSDRVYSSAENEAFYKAGAFIKYLNEYDFSASQRDFYESPEVDYLQLSNRIEKRTTDLALSVGSLGASDYEKMVLLTQFLSQTYTYSLTPLSNRERRDFVSTFLFETKKGYCTYFASALAIMARINGIPSRYVEGFRVDPNEVGDGKDYSKVTGRDAHAWAEVYIDGYGWMIFEATPIYSEASSPEFVPTLEELIAQEETTEAITNDSGETVVENRKISLEDLLAEEDGGRGNLNTDIPSKTLSTKSNNGKYVFIGFTLVLIVLLFFLRKLPLRYLRRKNTHGFAVRMIYVLAYLTAKSRDYPSTEPEYVFMKADYPQSEIKLLLKILYAKREQINDATVIKGIDTAMGHLKSARGNYIMRQGKFSYLKFRWHDITKLIP